MVLANFLYLVDVLGALKTAFVDYRCFISPQGKGYLASNICVCVCVCILCNISPLFWQLINLKFYVMIKFQRPDMEANWAIFFPLNLLTSSLKNFF